MLLRRSELLSNNILPGKYQQVEYLSSNTTSINNGQVINTGINVAANLKMKIVFSMISAIGNGNSLIGGYDGSCNMNFLTDYNSYFTCHWSQTFSIASHDTNIHIFEIQNLTSYQLLWDTNIKTITEKVGKMSSTSPLCLFGAFYISNGYINFGSYKIYNYQISYGDVMQRNFYPCYRKKDKKPGMYDIINKQFYINQTSYLEFNYGNKYNSEYNNFV